MVCVCFVLGENQIIQENKEYFRSQGINISALESLHSNTKSQKRSTNMILIKNLKHHASDGDELENMFGK